MAQEDTPPRQHPVIRQGLEVPGGDGQAIDSVWFYEWRREITTALREIRRDHSEALRGVDVRLGAIENRLNDGDSTIRKHDLQLVELIDQATEHERRLGKVEAHQLDALVARIAILEAEKDKRTAAAEAARQQEKATKASLWIRARDALVISAAGGVGLAIIGFLGWLITIFAKHG